LIIGSRLRLTVKAEKSSETAAFLPILATNAFAALERLVAGGYAGAPARPAPSPEPDS
jgi:hypothetical protein